MSERNVKSDYGMLIALQFSCAERKINHPTFTHTLLKRTLTPLILLLTP